jgi:hypothetical protein
LTDQERQLPPGTVVHRRDPNITPEEAVARFRALPRIELARPFTEEEWDEMMHCSVESHSGLRERVASLEKQLEITQGWLVKYIGYNSTHLLMASAYEEALTRIRHLPSVELDDAWLVADRVLKYGQRLVKSHTESTACSTTRT